MKLICVIVKRLRAKNRGCVWELVGDLVMIRSAFFVLFLAYSGERCR